MRIKDILMKFKRCGSKLVGGGAKKARKFLEGAVRFVAIEGHLPDGLIKYMTGSEDETLVKALEENKLGQDAKVPAEKKQNAPRHLVLGS